MARPASHERRQPSRAAAHRAAEGQGNDEAEEEPRVDDLSKLRDRQDRHGALCEGAPEHDPARTSATTAANVAASRKSWALSNRLLRTESTVADGGPNGF